MQNEYNSGSCLMAIGFFAPMVILLLAIILGIYFWLASIQNDGKKEETTELFLQDVNNHPARPNRLGNELNCGEVKWSNCGGDYKACRKEFAKLIAAANPEDKFENAPQRIELREDGDTLYMISYQYKDCVNRDDLADVFAQQFRDCKYSDVRALPIDAGGAEYYTIWTHYKKRVYTDTDIKAAQERYYNEYKLIHQDDYKDK